MAKCDMTKSLGEINFRLNNHGKFNGRKDICVGVWMMHRIIKCSKWKRYSEQGNNMSDDNANEKVLSAYKL